MKCMKIRAKGSFFIIILFVLSFFTSFAILEGNAVENISVSAKSFENTIIIEFKNGEQNTAKIRKLIFGWHLVIRLNHLRQNRGGVVKHMVMDRA